MIDLEMIAKMDGRVKKDGVCGIYRRYDGVYVCVTGIVRTVGVSDTLVKFRFFDAWDVEYVMPQKDFLGDEYKNTLIDGGEERVEVRKIKDHPGNVTGQSWCFLKVFDLENFGKNLSTEDLVNELKKRKDNPVFEREVNEGIADEDWVIGSLCEDSEGKFVSVKNVLNTKREAEEMLVTYKVQKRDLLEIYRRVYVKEN